MTCLKEELPLPHLFKKHVNKQTYKISPGSKGPKSAVNSTKAGQAPRYQLSGHNGNLHTTAHLHFLWTFQEPQAQISCPHQSYATSQNYFSSPHSPGASLGEGTTGMSSGVAQHQPTDYRSSTAMKSSPPQRRTQPFPPRQGAQCRLDGSGWVP